MVRYDKHTVLLDPCDSKIGLPEEGLSVSMPIIDVSPVAAEQLYPGDELTRPSSVEKLANTSSARW